MVIASFKPEIPENYNAFCLLHFRSALPTEWAQMTHGRDLGQVYHSLYVSFIEICLVYVYELRWNFLYPSKLSNIRSCTNERDPQPKLQLLRISRKLCITMICAKSPSAVLCLA